VATSDGLGWLLGDDGSAFWIGHQVARAVCEQLDRRGPATSLTAPVLADLGLPEDLTPSWSGRAAVLDDAIRVVYALRPVELSRLARLAFAAAGDAVADRILAEAAERLAATLVSLVTPHVTGPVVLGGSVLTRNPAFAARVQSLVTPHFPAPPEFRIVQDGAVGATVLALRHSGVVVDKQVFTRVKDTLRPLSA